MDSPYDNHTDLHDVAPCILAGQRFGIRASQVEPEREENGLYLIFSSVWRLSSRRDRHTEPEQHSTTVKDSRWRSEK